MRIVYHTFVKAAPSFETHTTIVKGSLIIKPGDITLYLYNTAHLDSKILKSSIVVHKLTRIK